MKSAIDQRSTLLYPLTAFDHHEEGWVARVEETRSDGLPDPYRRLLDHLDDMTPTLETAFGASIVLNVMDKRLAGQWLYRRVLLVRQPSDEPVEFGAIRIDLSRFSPEPRRRILEGHQPLGAILREFGIPHRSRLFAFLRLKPGPLILDLLKANRSDVLFGRRNTLLDEQDQILADIVEILSPVRAATIR